MILARVYSTALRRSQHPAISQPWPRRPGYNALGRDRQISRHEIAGAQL